MTTPITQPTLMVKQLFDRESCTYSYLLFDPKTREGALIDPVREQFDRDLLIIKELGIELLYTIETHPHADHVTSSGKIRQTTGAKIVFGANSDIQAIDISIGDQQELGLGNYQIRAITTPGHTSACTCYYIDGMLFSGDTLLIRGCGRTDFQDGDPYKLYDSITKKLFVLGDETIVYPAHDYNGRTWSTIGEEKKWNPRLGNSRDKQSFVDLMNNLNLDLPKNINEAVPANTSVGISFDPRRYLLHDFTMDDLHGVWRVLPDNTLIVDNRTVEEYSRGHVPGSRNIPLGSEDEYIEELKNFEQVYIYCRSGRRAQTAFTNLSLQGLDHLICISHSGMPNWVDAKYPVENG